MSEEAVSHRAVNAGDLSGWDHEYDVVVVGHGAAGACAAIEAAESGARTVVLEKETRGGGSSAASTGVVYFGGGTSVQTACGFDDSVDEMTKFVRMAAGEHADEAKVKAYCEGSVAHFDWLVAHGVEFNNKFVDGKTTHPFDAKTLFFSGNEKVYPEVEQARPSPRGHKVAFEGEAGGHLMEPLLNSTLTAGVEVFNECRVLSLVHDVERRVVGVIASRGGETVSIRATGGVVLCGGGFVDNKSMLERYAPALLKCNWNCSAGTDDGSAIAIGVGAGADATNMHEGLILNAYYPPDGHLKGIIVDRNGHRFVNEDAYLGRTSDAMLYKADGHAYLIVDDELFGPTQAMHKLAAVEETIEELEAALEMPEGELVHTVDVYNRNSAAGKDPLFNKSADYCRPLAAPPYAAIDCTTEGSIYGALTFGGLAVDELGRVKRPSGEWIEGLYAAGRCASGLCQEGRTYASGMSLGDASFFGRVAGRDAAMRKAGASSSS